MIIERDKKVQELQNNLFNQLSDIITNFEPKETKQKSDDIKIVDMESAIKELLAMGVK